MEAQVQKPVDSGLADSAKKVYSSAIAIYLTFCFRLNLEPVPASENTLILFIAELFQTKSYNTVHTYLAGVRHLHKVSGCPNPLDKALRLQLALRGYKRNKPPKPNPRLPITPIFFGLSKLFCLELHKTTTTLYYGQPYAWDFSVFYGRANS